MAQIIQMRRDTAANWTSVNPTLRDGEFGVEKDTGEIKMGDGVTPWVSLGYINNGYSMDEANKVANLPADTNTSLAAITNRVDDIITTPVPTGEIIAQEIIDARQGKTSVGANISEVKSQLADLSTEWQTQVDTIVANATVDSEVILARGGKASLDARLNASDAQLAEKVNSVNGVLPDLSGNVTIEGINNDNEIIAIYEHTANKEVEILSIDYDNNIFNSPNHGLTNNQFIFPIANLSYNGFYPFSLLPEGLANNMGYYVIYIDVNTFKISATSNSGIALNITSKATTDLTQWHFEVVTFSVNLTDLGEQDNIMLKITGRCLQRGASYIYVAGETSNPNYHGINFVIGPNNGAETRASLYVGANIFMDLEVKISTKERLKITAKGKTINSATNIANTYNNLDMLYLHKSIEKTTFNSVNLSTWLMANGFKVEVYKV